MQHAQLQNYTHLHSYIGHLHHNFKRMSLFHLFHSVLGSSLAYDVKAVQAILNFTQVRDVVNQALEIVQEANMTLNTVTSMVEELMEKNFSAQANSSVTEAQDALNIALQLNSTINGQNCGLYRERLL